MSNPSEQVEAIFNAVLELPADRRAAYLDEICLDRPALRLRIESLLHAETGAGDFLEKPAPEARSIPVTPFARQGCGAAEGVGDRIGRYKLLEQIGEGGCGVVFMAEQEEPVRRKVALKVIKLGMDTKQVVARFEAERQALALMDHANIAKVFDAGTTDTGRPYFVMELVRGIKITDFCDQQSLSTRERLDLFVQVCRAVQHAHQKGVIHRDLKPSNILVTVNDGVPVPKVIDFGIAKATQGRLTDRTLFTAFEQFLGTPAYMSPEQAVMTSLDIDTRSDIYSLGVLLYELLTGQTPFDTNELLAAGLETMRRTIQEKEPPRPSTRLSTMLAGALATVARSRQAEPLKLIHQTRGDLDWIVMKCLEKDRARRYETANGLANDIERHMADEPIVARPPSQAYAFQKLVRRHKLAFAAGTVVAALLILGLCGVTMAVFRVQRDNRQIRQAKDDATEKLWAAYLAEARANRLSGQSGQRFDSLDAVRNAAAIHANLVVRNEAIACLAVSDLRLAKQTTLKWRGPERLACVDFNLERYATGDENGSITLRAVADDRVLAVLPAPGFALKSVGAFSPNSRYLQARYSRESEADSERVWDLEQQKAVLTGLPGEWATAFSPDSRFFATSNPDGTLSIYDLGSGKEVKRLAGTRPFQHLVLTPANDKLACFSEGEPTVEIREVGSVGNVIKVDCPGLVQSAAWRADGKRLAVGCRDFRVYVWDVGTSNLQATLEGHLGIVANVAFSHTGDLLASAGWDGLTRLWNAHGGHQIASHPGSDDWLQFSPDDRYLEGWAEGSRYGSLAVAESGECRLLHVKQARFGWSGPEFSADGRIVAAGTDESVSFWDVFSGKEIACLPLGGCVTHIFHPDGRSVIVIDKAGGVCLRSLERKDTSTSYGYRLGRPRQFYAAAATDPVIVNRAALSLDGRHLAVTHESEGESFIFDLRDPAAKPVVLKPHPLVDYIAISPDGHWAATASWHNSFVTVWDARSGDLVRTLPMPHRATVAFSPDGRWLATSSTTYQLWEVGTWQPNGPPVPGHAIAQLSLAAFSPDGRVMARTTEPCNIQLQETVTGKPLATWEAPGGVTCMQFSPDGSHLAALQGDFQVRLWDLRLIRQELAEMHLDWDMPAYPPVEQAAAQGSVTLEMESDPTSPAPAQ